MFKCGFVKFISGDKVDDFLRVGVWNIDSGGVAFVCFIGVEEDFCFVVGGEGVGG